MNSACKKLELLRAQGICAFIPYITAGDPDLKTTEAIVHALVRSGADCIELGVPFSDPMADGPINQRAAERALRSGTTLYKVLELTRNLRSQGVEVPLVLFTYFNPVLKMGLERFAKEAAMAGVSAVLCVDLPPEEAGDYCAFLKREKLETVFLASPTTSVERIKLIDQASTGFVYYVSRTGVTGMQSEVSHSLALEMEQIKAQVSRPIAVGFGISTEDQASQVAELADAVVVGSALVKIIAQAPAAEIVMQVQEFANRVSKAIHEVEKCSSS